jgi:hypothetical protein
VECEARAAGVNDKEICPMILRKILRFDFFFCYFFYQEKKVKFSSNKNFFSLHQLASYLYEIFRRGDDHKQ